MFQYLFRMKRVQLELDRAWAAMGSQRSSFQATSQGLAKGASPLWKVRSHMAHFMNNLQLYIQVGICCLGRERLEVRLYA